MIGKPPGKPQEANIENMLMNQSQSVKPGNIEDMLKDQLAEKFK